jgi:hypothetical protein
MPSLPAGTRQEVSRQPRYRSATADTLAQEQYLNVTSTDDSVNFADAPHNGQQAAKYSTVLLLL